MDYFVPVMGPYLVQQWERTASLHITDHFSYHAHVPVIVHVFGWLVDGEGNVLVSSRLPN
jgi:hypothetical protein